MASPDFIKKKSCVITKAFICGSFELRFFCFQSLEEGTENFAFSVQITTIINLLIFNKTALNLREISPDNQT